MRTEPPRQLPIFRSRLQADILRTLFTSGQSQWTSRELARALDASPAGVARELHRLADAGLIRTERVGRSRIVSPETGSPVYQPLRQLIERTVGVEGELARRLEGVPGVDAAAIFGSWATGTAAPHSDVDVLVIGSPALTDLVGATYELQENIGREINFVTLSRAELDKSLRDDDPFVVEALAGPTIPLLGDVQRDSE